MFGDIPLNAWNVDLAVKFDSIFRSDHYTYDWNRPLGEWPIGACHIDMSGVWPEYSLQRSGTQLLAVTVRPPHPKAFGSN
jgi:hypothetical protein